MTTSIPRRSVVWCCCTVAFPYIGRSPKQSPFGLSRVRIPMYNRTMRVSRCRQEMFDRSETTGVRGSVDAVFLSGKKRTRIELPSISIICCVSAFEQAVRCVLSEQAAADQDNRLPRVRLYFLSVCGFSPSAQPAAGNSIYQHMIY